MTQNIVYVVNQDEHEFSPVLTKAEGKKEFCITASTEPGRVSFKNFHIFKIGFSELRKMTPESIGILLVTEKGGQYFPPQS
ncbi:hypothetical protein [Thalassolituus sp. UBA3500]|uniref:hypothetical protein n=1 Tax=Thalassolituus sp. UBA3500 TaxID=1947664 RepID=UPI000C0CE590|nr:hypothetical protein [Thalassolituus sp. UBA3500]MBN58266.1 hypothetical protein [Oceanospirillaceae bacterium]|tara:strand:- start:1369 stop:1611 length:243 start_codon:yes stop_codon:yes gene_type:complete